MYFIKKYRNFYFRLNIFAMLKCIVLFNLNYVTNIQPSVRGLADLYHTTYKQIRSLNYYLTAFIVNVLELGTGPAQDLILVFPRSCTRIATKTLVGTFLASTKILFGSKVRSLIRT